MTELLKPRPRDLLRFGAAFASVVALMWGAWSVGELRAQRDQLQAQVGALRNRPPVAAPSAPSTPPPPSTPSTPEPPATGQPGGATVIAAERPVDRSSRESDRQGGGRSGSGSESQPAPPSTPTDPSGSDPRCLLEVPPLASVCATVQIGDTR